MCGNPLTVRYGMVAALNSVNGCRHGTFAGTDFAYFVVQAYTCKINRIVNVAGLRLLFFEIF